MGILYIWICLYLVRTYVLIENFGMYVLVRGVRTSAFLTPSFPAMMMDDSFQTDLHKNDDRRRRRVAPIKMCRPFTLFFFVPDFISLFCHRVCCHKRGFITTIEANRRSSHGRGQRRRRRTSWYYRPERLGDGPNSLLYRRWRDWGWNWILS